MTSVLPSQAPGCWADEEKSCFLGSERREETQWPATARWPQPESCPEVTGVAEPGLGRTRKLWAVVALQVTAPSAALGASWMWVVPVALVGRAGCLPVSWGCPSGLLPPAGGRAARHLHWSKLPSGVLAWSAARDASSLCHRP